MKIRSIEHIAISVRDSRRSADWYSEMLGFIVASKNDSNPPVYFLRDPAGVGFLEIIPEADPSRLTHARTNNRHFHLGFEVDDFDEAYEELLAKGIQFEEVNRTGGGGIKSGFFRDPDGVPLQIVRRAKPLKGL
jgi:glyoxylase I family protein